MNRKSAKGKDRGPQVSATQDQRTNAEKATKRVQAILQETGCVIRSQVVIDGSMVTTKIYIEEATPV